MSNLPINIVLYGKRNCGKTTSLMELVVILSGISSTVIERLLKKRGRYKDARFIVEYETKLIFIGTGGDTWAICRGNTDFFAGKYSSLLDVFLISGGKIKKLDKAEKEIYKRRRPDVCICACRPDGDGYGAIKAIHSYSEKAIMSYKQQIWIQKDSQKESKIQASELKGIIDSL